MGPQKPVCLETRGHPVTTIRVTFELTRAGQGLRWGMWSPGRCSSLEKGPKWQGLEL